MHTGQKVRPKTGSIYERSDAIFDDNLGIVVCSYRVLREPDDAPHRLDVRFGEKIMVWGASETAFEAVPEALTSY